MCGPDGLDDIRPRDNMANLWVIFIMSKKSTADKRQAPWLVVDHLRWTAGLHYSNFLRFFVLELQPHKEQTGTGSQTERQTDRRTDGEQRVVEL